jgi:hypothetical protein
MIWQDGGLRKRILFVIIALAVFRLLANIPIPGVDTLQLFLKNLLEKNEIGAFEIIQSLHSQGSDIKQFQIEILKIAREKLHHAIQIKDLGLKENLLNLIELWQEINNAFKHSIIQELPLEILVVKFCNEFVGLPQKVEQPLVNTPTATVKPVTRVESTPSPTPIKITPAQPAPAVVSKTEANLEPTKAEPKAAIAEEKKPTKPETKSSAPVNPNFDIIKNWKLIIDKVTVPTVRIALKNAKVKLGAEEHTVELNVISNFEYDNLKKSENIKVIEDAILAVSEVTYKVNLKKEIVQYRQTENLVKKDIEARHNQADAFDPGPMSMDLPTDIIAGFKNNSADFALDMFEGELIE